MGRAARWLRNLLGGNKDGTKAKNALLHHNKGGPRGGGDKKRSSFSNLARHSGDGSPAPPRMESTRIRSSYYAGTDDDQNKHAIAVAAATAAAAAAAVAAAQAAEEVVRLTSHGRRTVVFAGTAGERWAAVKIQIAFRGFLAKKALRALKALVKLQALFRGYLVRRQAAVTLHSMQALIRAQTTVRAYRSTGAALPIKDHTRFYPEIRTRSSQERFDESRSEHTGSFHSRRLSASLDPAIAGFDDSPKIVEIDPGRPRSRNRRSTVSDSTTDESHSSPLPSPFPTATATSEWCFTADECRFSTAQSTPRFQTSNGQFSSSMIATAATPAKSVCCDGAGYNRRCSNPNYMAKTESFNAKVRSHSAPKQRPEPRKRVSLQDMVESRSSLSGVGMMRSCSRAQEAIGLKNTVASRMTTVGRSSEDLYLQRRW